MKYFSGKVSKILTLAVALFALNVSGIKAQSKNLSNDIVILYTNDVHCAIENNIGYSGFKAYKNECLEQTPFVTTVDAGDAIQGEVTGAIDKGESIVKLMNAVGDIFSIMPFGNTVCNAEVSGQTILDALEFSYRFVESESSDGKNSIGENGGFFQVSGLRFSVDPKVKSSVKVDPNGMFISVTGQRRVKDVKVLCGDLWTDIDPNAVYSITSTDYILKSQGDGNTMFKDAKITCDSFMFAYEAIEKYLTEKLKGKVKDRYSDNNENRIVVIKKN